MKVNFKRCEYCLGQMQDNKDSLVMFNYLLNQYGNGLMSKGDIVGLRTSIFEAMSYFTSFNIPEDIDNTRKTMWSYAKSARSFEDCIE